MRESHARCVRLGRSVQLDPSSHFAQGSGDLESRHVCELSIVTMSTVHGCDRQTRCSTEVAQREMNRPINSGKRVDGVIAVGWHFGNF